MAADKIIYLLYRKVWRAAIYYNLVTRGQKIAETHIIIKYDNNSIKDTLYNII